MKYALPLYTLLALPPVAACSDLPTDRWVIMAPGAASGYLTVKNGRLILAKDVEFPASSYTDTPFRWFVKGTQIQCTSGRLYLTYDPKNKAPRVFLARKLRTDAWWNIEQKDKRMQQDAGNEHGVIRVGTGPLRGWYLTIEERAVQSKGGNGKAAKTRVPVLAKDPDLKLEAWRIYGGK